MTEEDEATIRRIVREELERAAREASMRETERQIARLQALREQRKLWETIALQIAPPPPDGVVRVERKSAPWWPRWPFWR